MTAPLALQNTPNIYVCLSCVCLAQRGTDQTQTHDNVKESPRFGTGPTDSRDVMHDLQYTLHSFEVRSNWYCKGITLFAKTDVSTPPKCRVFVARSSITFRLPRTMREIHTLCQSHAERGFATARLADNNVSVKLNNGWRLHNIYPHYIPICAYTKFSMNL